MHGDFTRFTFKREKHYSGVRMQQGRVQLDAEWNEQLDIQRHRVETETTDVIGRCGAPMQDAGFEIILDAQQLVDQNRLSGDERNRLVNSGVLQWGGTDKTRQLNPSHYFLIGPGRYYVDGILCENEDYVSFTTQPHLLLPENDKPLNKAGLYLVYLDVWQQHLSAIEDPEIREVALGGPDTTTRTKTVWQVKYLKVDDKNALPNCSDDIPKWTTLINPLTGKLSAQVRHDLSSPDPCAELSQGGYRGLENRLYRVEIHQAGELGKATFKWSRDNGSVVLAIEAFAWSEDPKQVQVTSLGKDQVLGLHKGDWVEVLDDDTELFWNPPGVRAGQPGVLAQIDDLDPEQRVLTLNLTTADRERTKKFDLKKHPRIRRWDMPKGEIMVEIPADNGGWIRLEDENESGIEVRFLDKDEKGSPYYYNTGDYWLIPARTINGSIEWPQDEKNDPLAQPPHGIQHHYCRLALFQFPPPGNNREQAVYHDCRQLFPPLTMLDASAMHVVDTNNWQNDDEVSLSGLFNAGRKSHELKVTLDVPPDPNCVKADSSAPIMIVTVEGTDGLNPILLLNGTVTIAGKQICWSGDLGEVRLPSYPRIRVALKGHLIWSDPQAIPGRRLYLDGQAFGEPVFQGDTLYRTELSFPTGNGARASDFESWFYLKP